MYTHNQTQVIEYTQPNTS